MRRRVRRCHPIVGRMRITSENMTKSKSERASLLFMFVMLLQFFLINSDFTTILPLAYFQDLSDGLSDGIYLEGREKLAALCLYCMYIPRPWATTATTTVHSFVSSRWDWNSDWDSDWDLASIGACLRAWFGKENGNPARHTGREGGRARRSPQSLELRGRGHV